MLVFALAVLACQIILPLSYYLRDDPYDERFAWRMFSAERMHICSTKAIEIVAAGGGKRVRPLPLRATLHQAWLTHIKRNRRPVVHGFPAVQDAEVPAIFPRRVRFIQHARAFLHDFFRWYNFEHHHSGLALFTPADVHMGHRGVDEVITRRQGRAR